MKDYYYILGIGKEADSVAVKMAYRKLSLKFHPDKNNEDKFFEERFKEIQEAYETLSNQQKRFSYDKLLNGNYKAESQNQWTKEEELRKKEEELMRKEEKLKRKYQTPAEREREFKLQQAKKKSEEDARKKQEILKFEELLFQKENELRKNKEVQIKIKSEINLLQEKIFDLKLVENTNLNNEKTQSEIFNIDKFPKLSQELKMIKEYIMVYDCQAFREIFIQFTKNHSIDFHLMNSHNILVDIITNEKVPIKETERLFQLYKSNKEFINALEKEIIRFLK